MLWVLIWIASTNRCNSNGYLQHIPLLRSRQKLHWLYLKTSELLDLALIGACVVIGSNMAILLCADFTKTATQEEWQIKKCRHWSDLPHLIWVCTVCWICLSVPILRSNTVTISTLQANAGDNKLFITKTCLYILLTPLNPTFIQ